jgi:catalase
VPYNPFDLTKVWPHKDYPLIEVGVMELNRNPENFFAGGRAVGVQPRNVVPGIGFSPDKMLQGRLFSYGDAQRYRLGVNHHLIPVNAARCPVHSYHRDGAMRVDGNHGSTLAYEPNSYGQWAQQPSFAEPPLSLEGAADHWNHRVDEDYFSQPGALFRLMTPAQKQTLFENTARSIGDAPREIQLRHIRHCHRADPAYGKGIADALGISSSRSSRLSALPTRFGSPSEHFFHRRQRAMINRAHHTARINQKRSRIGRHPERTIGLAIEVTRHRKPRRKARDHLSNLVTLFG